MNHSKKGVGGITILFILIGVLLIAVVLSMLFLKTSFSMKNKASNMFDRTKAEASSAIKIIEIAGTDGLEGYLSEFTALIRLLPGSTDVALSQCSLMVSSGANRMVLDYREGGNTRLSNTGYNSWFEQDVGTIIVGTWTALEEDLNDDMIDDYVTLNDSHAIFNISGTDDNYSAIALSSSGSVDLSKGNQTLGNYRVIEEESNIYGYLNVSGFNSNKSLIESSVKFNVIPKNLGKGYYVVEYISRNAVPIENVLMDGDTIMIYFQGFNDFWSDEFLSFNLLCPSIIPIEKTLYIGNTIPKQRKVILYPKI